MVSSISSNSYYSTSLAQLSQQLFSLIDQDSDGSVTSTDLLSLTDDSSALVDGFMSKVDTNTDDAVTDLEFASALSKLIQEMKNNSTDGMSASGAPSQPESGEMFSSLDTDADGYLTVEELKAGAVPDAEKIFSEIDTDGDEKISQAESDAFDGKMRANAPRGMASAPPPPPDSGDRFSSLDTDADGYLTVEELQAGAVPDAETIFGEIEADGDEKISQAESDAFDDKMKANGPQTETAGSGSTSSTSLQAEFLNKLIEIIAKNDNYLNLTTKTDSLLA